MNASIDCVAVGKFFPAHTFPAIVPGKCGAGNKGKGEWKGGIMEIRAKDHFGLAAKIALSNGAREKLKRGEAIEDTEEFGDALVGLSRAIQHFDPKKGFKFSTFAYYCIQNEVRRAKKKRRIRTSNLSEMDGDVIDQVTIESRESDVKPLADRILSRFPNTGSQTINKRVLVDYYLKGKKLREIGDEIGVTKERVRQRREEALKYIRTEILAQERQSDLYGFRRPEN